RTGGGVGREARRDERQHIARRPPDHGGVGRFLGYRGAEYVELGPFRVQPLLEPLEDRGGIAGRRRQEDPVRRETGADAIVEYHAVLAAHDAVAAMPDPEVLPAIDVDAVEKAAGVGPSH